MKFQIDARYWSPSLEAQFGERLSEHELPDNTLEFLKLVAPFGRFQVSNEDDCQRKEPVIDWAKPLVLDFQNDYD